MRVLWISILLSVAMSGCAASEDELSRAEQEIDRREYSQAVERLENLAESDPGIQTSEAYLDLLTSAYLGESGVDLINSISHWAQTYRSSEELKSDASGSSSAGPQAVSLISFKRVIGRLVPEELQGDRMRSLKKALDLSNERILKKSPAEGRIPPRLLVKTIFVNFWATLAEMRDDLLPASERFLLEGEISRRCEARAMAMGSFQKVSRYQTNIALAVTLLGDQGNENINAIQNASLLVASLDWLRAPVPCEQLTPGDLDEIRKRFGHL